jgi:histidinol phosphatase-like PHP family hydrolase
MILDLHNHTRWSFDCSMDPAKVVRVAKAHVHPDALVEVLVAGKAPPK